MFTLEQNILLCSVTSEIEKDLRTANGPIRHLEFMRNFKNVSGLSRHLPTICLDYFVFPSLKNNVFKNRPGTIPELMQVVTDNCNLIYIRRSFENMKRRVTLCLEAEGRHFEHLL
jgi:hypothetical protein